MIQLSLLTVTPTAPVRVALPAGGGASSFAMALASLVLPGAVPKAQAEAVDSAKILLPGRQLTAESGKDLPVPTLDGEALAEGEDSPSEDKRQPDEADPALAWLPAPVSVDPAPAPMPAPLAAAPLPAVAVTDDQVVELSYLGQTSAKVAASASAVAARPADCAAAPAADIASRLQPAALPLAEPPLPPTAVAPATPQIIVAPEHPTALPVIESELVPESKPVERLVSAVPSASPSTAGPAAAASSEGIATQSLQALVTPAAAPVVALSPALEPTPTQAAPFELAVEGAAQPSIDVPPAPASPVEARPRTVAAAADMIASSAGRTTPADPIQATAAAAAPASATTTEPRARTVDRPQPAAPSFASRAPQTIVEPSPAAAPQIVAAEVPLPAALRRASNRDVPHFSLAPAAAAESPAIATVAPAGTAQQPGIDMRRQEWTGQMIEHIEALRDAAPIRETRIRLAPESLGNVDVSIRHEGDRVHVHFAAEAPAARQALADAQPRLAELAEAKGLKLGQTSVDAGSSGQSGARQEGEQRQPARPASARSGMPTDTDTDERIA
ncbi:flagellar hook-length control protein FliK [Sphingomonas sp. M1-B02]|uniref:flagellar hook-length control protein FliK n=1 Tax=Sphingomonas sp. M1-B02 TaxID=3114300 RepID=UPI00224089D5|nr:flagellar hook-length control protein FliK [Sphingomonas sp. S6-11]UZK65335.1 flagellar hook-length control protein FliK [Sphingomonas sp. S6-11]